MSPEELSQEIKRTEDSIRNNEQQLKAITRRSQIIKVQIAKSGPINAPADKVMEEEDLADEISQLETHLHKLREKLTELKQKDAGLKSGESIESLPPILTTPKLNRHKSGDCLRDRYEIKRILDIEAMDSVYLAYDTNNENEEVAIKQFNTGELSFPDNFEKRRDNFEREARAMREMGHVSIVEVKHVFKDNGTSYYVMRYIPTTLQKKLVQPIYESGLPYPLASKMFKQVCAGLDHSYKNFEQIHGHINPGNILLDNSNQPKITNFGAPYTKPILDFVPYLAPEQIRGEGIRPETDVYALGILFYKMLTGKGYDPTKDFAQNLKKKDIPRCITSVIRKALSGNPAKRYTNASAMLEAVEAAERGSCGIPMWAWGAIGVVVVLLVAGIIISLVRIFSSGHAPLISYPQATATPTTTVTPTATTTLTTTVSITSTIELPPAPPGAVGCKEIKLTEVLSSTSTIEGIQKRGYLIAGVKGDFPPFGWRNPDVPDQLVGFDVDLVVAMANEWGIEVKCLVVTSDNRLKKLLDREVDILAASMTHTLQRDKNIDFSQTYFTDHQSLLVRKGEGITDLDTLQGKKIGALSGSTSMINLEGLVEQKGFTIQPYTNTLAAIKDLQAAPPLLDAFSTDRKSLDAWANKYPDELETINSNFSDEPYGFGVYPGDSCFRDLVDLTLQRLVGGNFTYKQTFDVYFTGLDPAPLIDAFPSNQPDLLLETWNCADSEEGRNSRFQKISPSKPLNVGVKADFPPFGEETSDGTYEGFDIELVREIVRQLFGLGPNDNVDDYWMPIPVTSKNRIEWLESGTIDLIAASMTYTNDRDERIDFSQIYFEDKQAFLIEAGSGISSIEDLNGKTVAVLDGSTSADNIKIEAVQHNLEITTKPFTSTTLALAALSEDDIIAFATDSIALKKIINDHLGEYELILNPLTNKPYLFSKEPYGIGIPQNEDELRLQVNITLQKIYLSGEYDKIYCHWLGKYDPTPFSPEIWPDETEKGSGLIRKSEACPSDVLVSEVSKPVPTEVPLDSKYEYKVQSGESLYKIAGQEYGEPACWPGIAQDNGKTEPYLINPGDLLELRTSLKVSTPGVSPPCLD